MKVKNIILCALLFCFAVITSVAQTAFVSALTPIEKELVSWDAVRGKWLAENLPAIAESKTTSVRNFQEALTPFELIKLIPDGVLSRINAELEKPIQMPTEEETKWKAIRLLFRNVHCGLLTGRSYGDPHITSFDKANCSFQTVGEFVLMKSRHGQLEVQCRQKPQNENFSLNTAIAVNLAGDRIGLYATDSPDNNGSTLRINGASFEKETNYILPNGGTIRVQGNVYVLSAPTGEVLSAELKRTGNFSFINVNVQVFSCDRGSFNGLLGNANGEEDDDFLAASIRPNVSYSALFGNSLLTKLGAQAEKQYLSYLANQFAEQWRVSSETTLFEYPPGKNTLSFTDKSFPRVHLTLNDLTPKQQAAAREKCEANGVTGEDLRGCVFDQGFLNLDPNPRSPVPDFTKGVTLGKAEIPSGRDLITVPPINNIINNTVKPKVPKKNATGIKPGNLMQSVFPAKNVIPQMKSNPANSPAPPLKISPGSSPVIKSKGK